MSKYKMGSGIRNGTVERLKLAMGQDPSIACSWDEVHDHAGNTEDYLVSLGFTSSDLLRLERAGFAIRGRERTRRGHRVKWVVVGPKVKEEVASGGNDEQAQGPNS